MQVFELNSHLILSRSGVFLRAVPSQDTRDDGWSVLLHVGAVFWCGQNHDVHLWFQYKHHSHDVRLLVLPVVPVCCPVWIPMLRAVGPKVPEQAARGGRQRRVLQTSKPLPYGCCVVIPQAKNGWLMLSIFLSCGQLKKKLCTVYIIKMVDNIDTAVILAVVVKGTPCSCNYAI